MSENREIRFIDPHYNELFRIPDGGSVVVTRSDGEQIIYDCKYLDETHLTLGGSCYHICELAENLERNGSTVAPETEPEIVGGYRITRRIPFSDKVFVMGHNPKAVQPYVTWVSWDGGKNYDWGHYWKNRSDADTDLFRRVDSERRGVPYDHTKVKTRDDGAR